MLEDLSARLFCLLVQRPKWLGFRSLAFVSTDATFIRGVMRVRCI